MTTVRRRGLAVVLAASFVATTLVTAVPAVAQTDALATSSSSDDSRVPDVTSDGLSSAAAGLVSGRLQFVTDENPAGEPVVSGVVTAYRLDIGTGLFNPAGVTGVFDAEGDWSLADLPAGTYRFSFMQDGQRFNSRIWHDNVRFAGSSTTVTLSEGVALDFGTVVIPERSISYLRLAGPDRFSTSTALSQSQFSTGADVPVVIVNGLDYPDALSAGPLANALGGAMLMVTPSGIPTATAAELERLDPTIIIIVGGTGVVSTAVAQQLESYVTTSSGVVRIAGANRYATSRAVLEQGFGDFVPTAILLATGRNFPDALAASAAAGYNQGAVLLVDGAASTLDSASAALLDGYGSSVYVIGGTGSVSNGIRNSVVSLGLGGQRVSGADRSATSVAIALQFFGYADEAYVVNGSGFADALAAGPIAGMRGAPVYLTGSACMNNAVWNDIDSLGANFVTIVGGTGSLSNTVYTLTNCSGVALPGGFAGEASAPASASD